MTPDVSSRPTGVILAGGLSRRMGGGDKGLLRLAGKPMLAHVLDRLAPQVGRIVLNANGDPSRFASLGLPVVADEIEGFAGPLAGVLAGMRWSQGNAPESSLILTVSSDTPFLPRDLADRLLAARRDAPGAIVLAASLGEVHPVIGLWPVSLADDLEAALTAGVRKVLHWTDRHGTLTVPFEAERRGEAALDPFFNANTPQELAEAEALLGT